MIRYCILFLFIGGCHGQAGPVQIAVPESVARLEAFGQVEVRPACPPGDVDAGAGCTSVFITAYAASGGTTYSVDTRRGDDGADGSPAHPWRTLARAAGLGVLRPGDAVVIRAGVYRETLAPRVGGTGPEVRVTFAAYPGESVVISGAEPADAGWTPVGRGVWRHAWTWGDIPAYSDAHDWHFRRPLVIASGRVLTPVETPADLVSGSFTLDGPDDHPTALLARFAGDADPRAAGGVEIAVRTYGIRPEGADPYAECGAPATPGWLRFVGLTVRHTTNRAQWGAVCAGSRGGLLEDVAAEWTVGAGVDASGEEHVFRRVRADHNGQIGWVGHAVGVLIEDSQAVGNNWKGHDPFWEAGGGKWSETRGTVIRRHNAAGNAGPGIWLDGDNTGNTIEGCRVERNAMAGIMLELGTTQTLVQHNLITGTRRIAWTGTGILSQAASNNVYAFNTVVGSAGTGLWLRLDPDRRAPDGGNVVANNWIVGNALGADESREVSVEAESVAALRSTTFRGNAYGVVRGDPVWRSAFYAFPHGESGLRTNALAEWQATVGEPGASMASGWPDGRRAVPLAAIVAGAPGAGLRASARVGADPRLVRAVQP